MPDSSEIDQALIDALLGDPALTALVPGGVFWEEAPAGSTQFVIVSLVDAHDVPMFGRRAIEDAVYLVVARELSSVAVKHNKAAAARIDALLEQGDLPIPGYGVMVLRREARIRRTEIDEQDRAIRWFHRGGHYRLMVAPIATSMH